MSVLGTSVASTSADVASIHPSGPLVGSTPSAADPKEEEAIRKVVGEYGRAIETKDLELFKALKPSLNGDEEERLRRAFKSVQRQTVKISILSIEREDRQARVRVSRRDTIDGSVVSSFPQILVMARETNGWVIQEISR